MIYGIGTDIVEVSRIERECRREAEGGSGEDFLRRVFTSSEISYCEGKRRRFESYAARFAAKEAFLKALGTGGRDGISWLDMEVVVDGRGRPELVLRGRARALLEEYGLTGVFVSLSHSHELATAVAVLEGRGEV